MTGKIEHYFSLLSPNRAGEKLEKHRIESLNILRELKFKSPCFEEMINHLAKRSK